jgi:PAS domain S-box-containing protein
MCSIPTQISGASSTVGLRSFEDAVDRERDDSMMREQAPDAHFWRVFEQSRNPMSLLDADRRYVAVNDAMVKLYGYPREQLIGLHADSMVAEHELAGIDERWAAFMETGELYGEREGVRADGSVIRVQYATHATLVTGRRLALVVALSAHPEPSEGDPLAPVPFDGRRMEPSKPDLTPRERDVIARLALGMTGPEISAELYISSETVRTHVRNAMLKMNAHTRAQLVATALAEGLIGNPF